MRKLKFKELGQIYRLILWSKLLASPNSLVSKSTMLFSSKGRTIYQVIFHLHLMGKVSALADGIYGPYKDDQSSL